MRFEQLSRWLRRQPFKPFRLWVLEQTSYEIQHPDQVLLLTHSVELIVPLPVSPGKVVQQTVEIALLHISHLETLPPPRGGNGG
jgi:hypothetical protein